MIQHKSKFDLEPNPFERSFATKESSSLSLNELANDTTTNNNNDTNSEINSIASTSAISSSTKNNGNSSNKHNLHIPNISTINQQSSDGGSGKLPGITPPLFTPGGRRLPPIGLSPGGSTAKQYTSGLSNGSLTNNPDSSLWPNFIGNQNLQGPQLQLQQNFSQLLSGIRKTGLTPNESNLRLGLTPGGLGGFGFGSHLAPGLSTPSALLNGPITPGLSSLLGIPANSSQPVSMNSNTSLPLQQPQQPQPLPQPLPQLQQPIVGPQQAHIPGQLMQPPSQQQLIPQQTQEITNIPNVPTTNQDVSAPSTTVPAAPQIAQQLPQQQQQPGVIHTIPENPVGSFPISSEQETVKSSSVPVAPVTSSSSINQDNASTSPPATTTRKRKSSVKLVEEPLATKKPRTIKSKKKEPKAKLKAEPESEPVPREQPEQQPSKDDDDKSEDKEEAKLGKGRGKRKTANDEEKRKNFLERNRVAASKCRQRKKQLIQKMEDELAFYLTGYRELSAQVAQLRSQLMTLKNVISGHKDCGMFIQYIGGFNALNELLQQADFATQVTEGAHTNMTSMPSTIPTTLNNVPLAAGASTTAAPPPPQAVTSAEDSHTDNPPSAPTSTMAPPLPISVNGDHDSTQSNTRNATPEVSFGQQQQQHNSRPVSVVNNAGTTITSHHSLTDLPAAASAAMGSNVGVYGNNNRVDSGDGGNNGRDLRAISSMSNLAAMNSNNGAANTATTVAPF